MRTPASFFYRRLWKQAEADREAADRAVARMIELSSQVADLACETSPSVEVRAAARRLRHDVERLRAGKMTVKH